MRPTRGRIVVFGSINLDLVARVARFPQPGETVGDATFSMHPGGKGANQALAAARAGARVALAGCVGDDPFGELALANLRPAGIDLAAIRRTGAPTGTATILVDAGGRNCIAVAPGANACARVDLLAGIDAGPGDWLLLQGELDPRSTAAAVHWASARGARVMLNLAPPIALAPKVLAGVACLVVNEHEAQVLASRWGWSRDVDGFARAWSATCGNAAVVTLGEAGALACAGGSPFLQPAPRVDVVDTTGAGDAFVGTLAAALAEGTMLADAVRHGVAAGALACTELGAQAALPGREAIAALARGLAPGAPIGSAAG